MKPAPVPADVYAAARRSYVLSSHDLFTDDELVRAWANKRWSNAGIDNKTPWLVAFWVLSQAAQNGHE